MMSYRKPCEHPSRKATTKQASQMGRCSRAASAHWVRFSVAICISIALLTQQASTVRAQSSTASVIDVKVKSTPTSSPPAASGQIQVIKIGHVTTTSKPTVVVNLSGGQSASASASATLHRHFNKQINITDKLHKFDLYIDPVCDQIAKLTDKQLNKVYAQLRQFSQSTNNALAKCLAGLRIDVAAHAGQLARQNLANFCSARALTNEAYKQFSSCATSAWSSKADGELDRALKDRLHVSKTRSKAGLTASEISLIDEIVAHLHEDQAQEIAAELAKEHQNMLNASSSSSSSSTTASKQVGAARPAAIGKLNVSTLAPAAAQDTKAIVIGNVSGSEHSAKNIVIHLQGDQRGTPSPPLVVKPFAVTTNAVQHTSTSSASKQLPASSSMILHKANGQDKQLVIAKAEEKFSAQQNNDVTHLTSQSNIRISFLTTTPAPKPTTPRPPTISPISSNNSPPKSGLQLQGTGTNLMNFLQKSNKSITLTVTDNKAHADNNLQQIVLKTSQAPKPTTTTTKTPVLLLVAEKKVVTTSKPVDILLKQTVQTNTQQFAANANQNLHQNSKLNLSPAAFWTAPPTAAPVAQPVVPPPPTVTTTTTTVTSPIGAQQNLASPIAPPPAPAPAAARVAAAAAAAPATAPVQPVAPVQPIQPAAPAAAAQPIAPIAPQAPPPATLNNAPLQPAFNQAAPPAALPAAPQAAGAASIAGVAPVSASAAAPAPVAPEAPIAQPVRLLQTTSAPTVSPLAKMLLNSIDLTTKKPSEPNATLLAPAVVAPVGSSTAGAASAAGAGAGSNSGAAVDPVVPVAPAAPVTPVPPPAAAVPIAPPAPAQASAIVSQTPVNKVAPVLDGDLDHPLQPVAPAQPALTVNAAAAQGSAAAATSTAVGGKLVEPSIMRNVDKALSIMDHPDHKNSTKIEENTSNKTTVINVIVSKTTTTTTTPKPTTTTAPTTTTTQKAETTVAAGAAAKRVLIVNLKSEQESSTEKTKTETKKEVLKTSKEHEDEHELMRLKNNADSSTSSVHDVIVVGDHVEGDDLLHDYEDHSEHHETHSSSAKSAKHNEHEHEHHDESKTELKIEHAAETKKQEVEKAASSSSKKTIEVKTRKKEINSSSGHADHEHLLDGLSVGDVIHVEAGELEGTSD